VGHQCREVQIDTLEERMRMDIDIAASCRRRSSLAYDDNFPRDEMSWFASYLRGQLERLRAPACRHQHVEK
jgi:hypothetical protein